MPEALLSEFTILDLTEGAGGPFCTKLFADYGARVIKVERPGRGDPARRLGPFPRGPSKDAGVPFLYLNAGKESATLDMSTATGRGMLLDLAGHADAVVESFKPGYLEDLGLGAEALQRRHPRLVVTSVSAFGRSGPYATWRWTDLTAFAAGGQMSLTGEPDREPLVNAGRQAMYQAGIHAFGATLAGLHAVSNGGVAQQVEVAAMECMAATLEIYLPHYATSGIDILSKRRGNAGNALLGIFPCADGHVGVHVMARNFASFARVMGTEWMIEDERFRDGRSRLINNDEMLSHVYAWSAGATRDEIMRRAAEERSTLAPVLSIPEVLAQTHLQARESFRTLADSRAGDVTYPRPPFRSGEGECELRAAPFLGEHNAPVYGELLSLERRDLARLRSAGVI